MTQEKAWIALAWSGDAAWAIDEAAEVGVELDYAVPEEGATVWFDGWVIPKYAKNVKEGVKVRALYDGFGNSSNNKPLRKKHLKKIRANGIEIYEYKPLKFPWVHAIFNRDHRKIVIIDGQIAYTGGMNVADYYIKGTEVVGEWHDMHCRIDGSEVNTLQKIFLKMWNKVSGQNVHSTEFCRLLLLYLA